METRTLIANLTEIHQLLDEGYPHTAKTKLAETMAMLARESDAAHTAEINAAIFRELSGKRDPQFEIGANLY